jgi:AcrR family transcriptional regulator
VKLALEPSEPVVVPLDGRRLRAEESRRRVVGAMLDLVREGDVDPSAEDVARRAGVGLRTVFRLFKDKESLMRRLAELVEAQFVHAAAAPLAGDTWRARLDDMIERRLALFEKVLPYRRAGVVHAHRSAYIRNRHERLNASLRHNLAAVLPASLRQDGVTLDALDLLLWIDTWARFRLDQGLTPAVARSVIRRMVDILLDTTAADD